MTGSHPRNRIPRRAYLNGAAGARSGDARERIMLGAAVADLREDLYVQQCLLAAVIETLAGRGLVDEEDLRRRLSRVAAAGFRVQEPGPPAGPAPPATSSS